MTDDDAPPPPAENEPTVRQFLDDPSAHSSALDAATLAELHRWFGMPAAMDLAPEPAPEFEVRRQAAMAAVDAGFLAYLQRIDARLPRMMEAAHLELQTDETLSTIPERFVGAGRIGEPREIEIPMQLENDLKECVPQALLRDLHRTEEYFQRFFEINQVCEPIPDIHRDLWAAIRQGDSERKLMIFRDELSSSIAERISAVHDVSWATLSRAAPELPGAAEEPST
jgi:hypothetical protein